jgi:predicted N-acetyltransferase YhbS
MTTHPFSIESESPADALLIDALLDDAFGLSRRTKTSYRFREGETAIPGLSLVARAPGVPLAGTISFWRLIIGAARTRALLLGPLAVHPAFKNQGIGLKLMEQGLALAQACGERLVLLVGDAPYYDRAGFRPAPVGRFVFPGPVDPARLLYRELAPGALDEAGGLVLPPGRVESAAAPGGAVPASMVRPEAPACPAPP